MSPLYPKGSYAERHDLNIAVRSFAPSDDFEVLCAGRDVARPETIKFQHFSTFFSFTEQLRSSPSFPTTNLPPAQ